MNTRPLGIIRINGVVPTTNTCVMIECNLYLRFLNLFIHVAYKPLCYNSHEQERLNV